MEFKTAKEMRAYATKRHMDDVNKELEDIFNKIADACELGTFKAVYDAYITDAAENFLITKGYNVKYDSCNNESYTTISW